MSAVRRAETPEINAGLIHNAFLLSGIGFAAGAGESCMGIYTLGSWARGVCCSLRQLRGLVPLKRVKARTKVE